MLPKIPLHAVLDCICAAIGCHMTVSRWFDSLQANDYVEQNKAILKMRKVCHSFAYGELRFGLLEMIVITLSPYISYFDVLRPTLSLVQVPEFWVKNSRSVKAVRMNDFRDKDVRIGITDGFLGFLSNVKDISFNYCGLSSKTLEMISFSSKTHRVTLRWCGEIDDLSSLKNVHTVRLLCSGKNQQLDVSVLEHCHTLVTGVVLAIGVEKSNIRRFKTIGDRRLAQPWRISRTGDFWLNHPGIPLTIPSVRDMEITHLAFNQT